jgi:hypothetical protein
MFGHNNLLNEGAETEGVVLQWKPAPLDRTKDRLTIGVKFEDGETAEFTEDITNYYQPPAHGLKGERAEAELDGNQQHEDVGDEDLRLLDEEATTLLERDAAGQHGTAHGSDADELAKLADLHRSGDLSDEEFAAAKRRILGG